jgi:hypothetical protein
MNPTKFGSPNLDTPNSSYDFLKFAMKSKNQIKNNQNLLTAGPRMSVTQRQVRHSDRRFLADDKVSGDATTTTTLYSPSCVEGYPQLARWLTGAGSTMAMVDGGGGMVVRQRSLAIGCSGEAHYSYTVAY